MSRSKVFTAGFLLLSLTQVTCLRQTSTFAKEFIVADAPLIALTHLRVIDGTGAAAKEDQTILIEAGLIKAIGGTAGLPIPGNAKVLDLKDHTAIPGLVGMHEHLFYSTAGGTKDVSAAATFPRLYLAAGVTTIRTAGTLNLDDDVAARDAIDSGHAAGPKIYLTSPYINWPAGQPLEPSKVEAAFREWAGRGVTSLKIYTNTGSVELRTAIAAAHKSGLKVTGHLCAVGYRDAIDLGIDNLEHGLIVDTEFYLGKRSDECPNRNDWLPEFARVVDVHEAAVQELIRELVSHHVAITSTLPIFESFTGEKFRLDPRMEQVLTPAAYAACLSHIAAEDKADPRWPEIWQAALRKEMEFEYEFVRAGGLLLAGVDPTGWGGVLAGFGDQRGLELLVVAGFTPEQSIQIATANGATFLGESDHIGTLAVGKQADIAIIHGNPSANISDVKNVRLVFKNGIAYDSEKLIESLRGQIGE